MIDQTAALTLISFLDSRFGARKKVRVQFNRRKEWRGMYYPRRNGGTISLPPVTENWIVCHEYAHHLDRLANHTDAKYSFAALSAARTLRNTREGHSESFYYNLRRVIEATGIDYPWHKEYRQVLRWAKRDGLV